MLKKLFTRSKQTKDKKDKKDEKDTKKDTKKARVFFRPYTNPFIRPAKPVKPVINKPVTTKPVKPVPNKVTVVQIVNQVISDKAASLIGLNYTGTSAALNGCINDANRMRNTLVNKYGYQNVKIFTDVNVTVKNNILEILDDLIRTQKKNLFFQFSGHGTQIRDGNGDEGDGMDECLYSVGNTLIVDDEVQKRVKNLPVGTTLIMVIDACHSGSIIDLPYRLDNSGNVIKDNDNQLLSNVICISGCRDNQTSMDITSGRTAYGAMSNALQAVLANFKGGSWRDLINLLRGELAKNNYEQIPQLSVSRAELIDSPVRF